MTQNVTRWYATGADISSHQHQGSDGPIWNLYRDRFVIVKATEGASYTNPFYADDVEGARKAGKTVGHYLYIRKGSQGQGAYTVDVVKPHYKPGEIVWLDFEDGAHDDLEQARAALKAAGMRTGTYTYPYWWQLHGTPACDGCKRDPLWFAWYNPAPIDVPAPWRKVALWQYAGTSVKVAGLPGLNDHNRLLDRHLFGKPPRRIPTFTLRPGARRWLVKVLQRRLNAHGAHLVVDGVYGPATLRAVNAFKHAHHLKRPGVVGPWMWRCLFRKPK